MRLDCCNKTVNRVMDGMNEINNNNSNNNNYGGLLFPLYGRSLNMMHNNVIREFRLVSHYFSNYFENVNKISVYFCTIAHSKQSRLALQDIPYCRSIVSFSCGIIRQHAMSGSRL